MSQQRILATYFALILHFVLRNVAANGDQILSPSVMYRDAVAGGRAAFSQRMASNDKIIEIAGLARDSLETQVRNALFDRGSRVAASTCNRDIALIFAASSAGALWAAKYLDSSAAKPSGFLSGNFRWYGDFDECRGIAPFRVGNRITISPKYCRVELGFRNSTYFHKPPTMLPDPIGFTLGVCVPNSCNVQEIGPMIDPIVTNLSLQINADMSRCIVDDIPYNGVAIFSLIVFSLVGLCLLTGLAVDVFLQVKAILEARRQTYNDNIALLVTSSYNKPDGEEEDGAKQDNNYGATGAPPVEIEEAKLEPTPKRRRIELFVKVAICFSPYENFTKLYTIPSNDASPPLENGIRLNCINGIRTLSLLWVMLGHTYYYPLFSYDNVLDVFELEQRKSTMFLNGGFYAVDTFLFLSGFLAYWSMSKQIKPNTLWQTLPGLYIQRYVRLTPPMLALILVDLGLWRHFSTGPFYFQGTDYNCENNWWTNLLYLNNLVDTKHQCIGWSWYLAVDMQLYLLTPFLVYLFVWKPRFGWLASFGVLIVQAIIAISLTYDYNMPSNMAPPISNMNYTLSRSYEDYYDIIYIKPYMRMAAYVVGAVYAHIALKHAFNLSRQIFARIWLSGFMWICTFTIMLVLIYGQYDVFAGNYDETLFVSALYNAFGRTAWCIALGWLMLACIFRQGGPIGRILEWNGWAIPARLSYCGYLIHPFILLFYSQTARRPFHVTDMTMIFMYLGTVLVTLIVSTLFSLAFESPTVGLLRFLIPSKSNKPANVK